MAVYDDLATAIATYLEKTPADFLIGGTNLLLLAVNNAKKWAQQTHDFELCRTQASVTVSLSSGGTLSSAVLPGTSTAVDVKLIEAAYLAYGDGGLKPIWFVDKKNQTRDLRTRLQGWPYRSNIDSPPIDSAASLGLEDTPQLVQQGDALTLWPASNAAFSGATSFTVRLDVVKWLPDYVSNQTVTVASAGTANYNGVYTQYGHINGQALYISATNDKVLFWISNKWWITPVANLSTSVTPTAGYSFNATLSTSLPVAVPPDGTYTAVTTSGSPTVVSASSAVTSDFFLTRGFEFLMWKAIVDGNYLWKSFVGQDEGNISAPEKLLASAWANLLAWDGSFVGQNNTAFNLD